MSASLPQQRRRRTRTTQRRTRLRPLSSNCMTREGDGRFTLEVMGKRRKTGRRETVPDGCGGAGSMSERTRKKEKRERSTGMGHRYEHQDWIWATRIAYIFDSFSQGFSRSYFFIIPESSSFSFYPFFWFPAGICLCQTTVLKSLQDGAEIKLLPSIFNTCLPCLQK